LFSNITNSRNTAVGEAAGYYTSSQGTFVGDHAYALAGLYNVTALGYNTRATASNQVRIGNTTVKSIGGCTSWSTLSDGRFKTNIKDNVPGLIFINLLKPITFTLDQNKIEQATNSAFPSSETMGKESNQPEEETVSKKEHATVISTGFIAQEVETAAKTLNYDFDGVDKPKNSKDFYGLRYAEFVVPLVKAVQELDAENQELKARIERLELLINETSNMFTGSGAYLEQNTPNPVSGNTLIRYHLPTNVGAAKLTITNIKGQLIKVLSLTSAASGQLLLNTQMLAAGTYSYNLWVDGKQVDTKRFIIAR
jgi:trimeric autotransporter adhesin